MLQLIAPPGSEEQIVDIGIAINPSVDSTPEETATPVPADTATPVPADTATPAPAETATGTNVDPQIFLPYVNAEN